MVGETADAAHVYSTWHHCGVKQKWFFLMGSPVGKAGGDRTVEPLKGK